ncbi:MAG: copper resistance protein CopC [Pseudonocardiaceae bacterium]
MNYRRALWVVVCAVLGLLLGAGPADAHATLISTDPGQGAVLAAIPATVSLTFSEPVVVAADGVRVFGPDGAPVDNGRAAHLGRSSAVGVGVPAARAQQGTYTVSWRVISADSHPVAGAFTFSVGHPSMTRAPADAQPGGSVAVGVSYAITRAAAFASYALLVGSIGFVLLCWPGAIGNRGVRRVMLFGWAGLLATTVGTLLLQGPYGNGRGLDRLLDSTIVSETLASRLGTALTARLLVLALAGGYLVLLCAWLAHLGRRGRRWFGVVGVALAVGLAGTWAGADHAAVGVQPELALGVDIVHLLTMGVWLGGLTTLAILLRGADNAQSSGVPYPAIDRFSAIATGSIVILIGTGSYQSWRQLGSWGAFGSTDYGRLLLVKLGAFALLLGVASLSHRCVTRHRRTLIGVGAAMPAVNSRALNHGVLSRSTLRRSVAGEAALGAVVLGVTALLVNAEPGRTATAAPPGPAHHVVSYDTGGPNGQGQLIADIDPAATGPNEIRVTVENPSGTRHDVAELRAELTLSARQLGPFTIPLQHNGPGRYEAGGVAFPYPGAWQLRIVVRSSEIDETGVAIPLEIR